jgi:Leucine-rich repeat (LRR) protein
MALQPIRELSLRESLKEFPAEWAMALSCLTALDLAANRFVTVPHELAQITTLQSLDLSYNKRLFLIEEEAEPLAPLSNLQTLRLKGLYVAGERLAASSRFSVVLGRRLPSLQMLFSTPNVI